MSTSLKGIEALEKFLFEDLDFTKHLKDLEIDRIHFETIAEKACKNEVLKGYKPLNKDDIKAIYEMCL